MKWEFLGCRRNWGGGGGGWWKKWDADRLDEGSLDVNGLGPNLV